MTSQLLRPISRSFSTVAYAVAALLAASAITALRHAVPLAWVLTAHWSAVLAVLVVAGFGAPFLAFGGRASWKSFSINPRPWVVAGVEVAVILWVVTWSGVAVVARLVAAW